MSLPSTTNRDNYTGNGAVDTYSYTFRIFTDADLLITVKETATAVETTLSLTTDYTVTGVGDLNGGSVVLVDASQDWIDGDGDLDTGWTMTIRRVVSLVQDTDLRNQGDFYPESHEDTFDYSRMIDQQQQDEINRSGKLPEALLLADFDPTFPTDLDTAEIALVTNATGDGFAVGPSITDIAQAATNAAAAAISASAASSSETSAAASAASAASQLASAFFTDVVFYTSASSPVTLATADNGKLHSFDSSGGAITVNLPEILGEAMPFNVAFLCTTAGNDITVNRGGASDLINGSTSKILNVANTGFQLVADTDPTPDAWAVLEFGSVGDGTITTIKLADDNVTRDKLATGAVAREIVVTKTAAYTILNTDDAVFADTSGGAFTLTVPTAVGNGGKVLEIIYTDSGFANALTVSGVGITTTTLDTEGERLIIASDGANWLTKSRVIPSTWTTYIPTGDWTGNVTYNGKWKRVGDSAVFSLRVTTSAAPTPSSTTLTFDLPSGLAIDTAKLSDGGSRDILGTGTVFETTVGHVNAYAIYSTTTDITVLAINDGSAANHIWDNVQHNYPVVFGANDKVTITTFNIPISGWNG